MKKYIAIIGLAALTHTGAQAAIVITEVMSSSAHTAGTNNGDWFELTNTGLSAVNITGWSWDDADNVANPDQGTFGGITSIGAGQSIVFTAETLGEEAAWITDWGLSGVTVVNLGGGIFQNFSSTITGDALYIYDNNDALVTSVTFGLATTGSTFEWDTNGNTLGLSIIGQNGAFQAVENGQTANAGSGLDIGSPGFAIPEPSTALLGAFGLLALLRRRR